MARSKATRNRPDHDGKDRSRVDRFRRFARENELPCCLCGLPINYNRVHPDPWSFTVEHLIPVHYGGTSDRDNIGAAHFRCNRIKGTNARLTPLQVDQLRLEQGARPITSITPSPDSAPSTSPGVLTPEGADLFIDSVFTPENCIEYEGGGYGLRKDIAKLYVDQLTALDPEVNRWNED